jgi:exonuclease SbcD
MISLVWRTDVHISEHTPISRTDDWLEAVEEKLLQVAAIARKHKASAVIDGGDFFHYKSPSKNSFHLVNRVMSFHKKHYSCPVYCNVGNHDCVYGDYKMLPRQPLESLYLSGTFRRLYDQHEAVFTRGDVKVRVVGIPYHGTRYDWDRFSSIQRGDEDYLVVAGHVLASPQGGSMFEGEDIIKYSDLSHLPVDVWAFGHWHKDQGITKNTDRQWIINVGSLTRGSLSEDHLDRKPCAVVLKFSKDGLELERVDIQIKPSIEVFDLEKKSKEDTRKLTIEAFCNKLTETLASNSDTSIEEKIQRIHLDNFSPARVTEVKERALEILERHRHE